jgi:hypothetical protein
MIESSVAVISLPENVAEIEGLVIFVVGQISSGGEEFSLTLGSDIMFSLGSEIEFQNGSIVGW